VHSNMLLYRQGWSTLYIYGDDDGDVTDPLVWTQGTAKATPRSRICCNPFKTSVALNRSPLINSQYFSSLLYCTFKY
jgi:hypothetical protein